VRSRVAGSACCVVCVRRLFATTALRAALRYGSESRCPGFMCHSADLAPLGAPQPEAFRFEIEDACIVRRSALTCVR
jgi:hypothetical protein